jgi:hypothetical protein
MYMSYMLYQAERVKTVREQREVDAQTGWLAAEFGRSWRSAGRRRARGQRWFRGAVEPTRPAACVPGGAPPPPPLSTAAFPISWGAGYGIWWAPRLTTLIVPALSGVELPGAKS